MGRIYLVPVQGGCSAAPFFNYCNSNAVAICDSYSYSRLHEYIDSMGKLTVVFTLDGKYEYWLFKIDECDWVKLYIDPIISFIGLLECHAG